MPNLKLRSTLPEKMDEAGVAESEINIALHELEVINTWLGGFGLTLDALKQLEPLPASFSVMDLGCGGGDMLRKIAQWSERHKHAVTLIGVDRNPVMTQRATIRSSTFKNIRFITADIFDEILNKHHPDIVTSTLFCHHFDHDDLVELIKRKVELARLSVIINDLHRHPVAYHSIKFITRFFSKSYLVKYDGPLSVARSLTRNEWQQILTKAGVTNYSLKWRWAWRWQIIIRK